MSQRRRWLVALAMVSILVGAGSPGAAPAAEGEVVVAAQEALGPFKKKLMAALHAGLEKGPAEAVTACRQEAPEIASSLATTTLHMGRTSRRLRNPQNAPELWMAPLLDEFLAASPGEIEHRVVATGPDSMGYVEPIYMAPLCLTCHGEAVAPGVRDRLHALYPQDEATGYAIGDFRGLFWVEFRRTDEDD